MTVRELMRILENVSPEDFDCEVRIESIELMSSSTPVNAHFDRNVEPNRESVFIIEV